MNANKQPLIVVEATVALDRILGMARHDIVASGRSPDVVDVLGRNVTAALERLEIELQPTRLSLAYDKLRVYMWITVKWLAARFSWMS